MIDEGFWRLIMAVSDYDDGDADDDDDGDDDDVVSND